MLSVLDAISVNNDASQRELSRATGLNVAKVNHLLKKLVTKGCVKLRNVQRNPNKLGYLYILTPNGITEKSRLTIRFARRTWMEYSKTLEKLRERLVQLSGEDVSRVVLLGANEVADMVLDVSKETELSVVAIVDSETTGESRKGVPIVASANGIAFDKAILCSQSSLEELPEKFDVDVSKVWLV